MHNAGIHWQQASAAPAVQQRHEDRTQQVADPGLRQNRPHLSLTDGAGFDAQRQEHGMAGEQF
ncbi:hypothetical protein D1872_337110 [compost metagenome]